MNVGIAGLGLIGGSMAKAIHRYAAAHSVFGLEKSGEILETARLQGVVQAELTRENAGELDLLLLALYPDGAIQCLRELAPGLKPGALVVDLCGVKRTVVSAITPIARKRGELLELDLVLRNNITTEEFPLGVFHPHPELHHIKKENIGLIEVMGLAVLPSRLKTELAGLEQAIVKRRDIRTDVTLAKHADWVDGLKQQYVFTPATTRKILLRETGKVFSRVLEDAGVFKRTPEGQAAFLRFLTSAGGTQ